MEKITSNNTALSNNFIFADISKNMTQKSDLKTDVSFKDYVRSNSNENNKFETKRDFKKSVKSENNEKEKTEAEDRSVKNNSIKKDSLRKDEKINQDSRLKNTSDDKDQSKENDNKVENTSQKDVKLKDNNQNVQGSNEEDEAVEESFETNVYMYNMQVLQNNEMQEEVKEDAVLISDISDKNELQPMADETPNEESTVLNNLPKDLSPKIESKKTDEIELGGEFSALTGEEDEKTLKTFKEVVKDVSDKNKVQRENSNIENDTSKIDIAREIDLLKEEVRPVINNQANEELNINNDLEIESPVNISIDTTVMRNFVLNNKITASTVGRATLVNEQIQNFAKIVDEMRVAFRGNKTSFYIKLEPESLGKLSVRINSENGVFNASFFVDSQKAKQAIENDIHILRQSLLEQGVNVQEINVQVGQSNQETNYHQNIMEAINFSKKGGVRLSADELVFEEVINPYMVSDEMFNDLY
ncbi:flagellar hook-length control protein FliK [Peptostreptococcaceae bacterium AS15]|nr:flagellar hook-length control protein FliK [Peptostreptococcaceae bacterium AS15]